MKGEFDMDNRKYFIYITTNNLNGCKYIGKHLGHETDSYLGSGKILVRAIEKYGKENFSREIIEFNSSEEENAEREKYYIALYNATTNPLFYNIHEGGKGGYTTAGYTEEEKQQLRQKLSELNKGEKNGMYGKHHSQKTKDYLSFYASNIRDNSVYKTKEYRNTMSKLTSGKNNGMYGKHHTEESKKKMSQSSIGKCAGEKNGMYGKRGEKALNGKRIGAFDKEDNLIHIFQTKQLALSFLGLKGHVGLDKAIKQQIEYKGYYWKELPKFEV